ncbi:MAG: hypothetical protein NZ934_03240 [Hadesarchaea archaeon]|nr:hypothetical protein [Hadesarchaea archaeon]
MKSERFPTAKRVEVALSISRKGLQALVPYLRLRWRGQPLKVGYRDPLPFAAVHEALVSGECEVRVVATSPQGEVLVGPRTRLVVRLAAW